MTKKELLKSARELNQPSKEAAREFTEKVDRIALGVIERLNNRPDLDKLIGDNNRSMMEDNTRNFTRFMDSLFHEYKPEVFIETVLWAVRTYRAHGFLQAYWPANLDTFVEVNREVLSEPAFAEIYPFYKWITVNIPVFFVINEG